MTQKRYFYDIETDEIITVFADEDGVEFAIVGMTFLTTDVEQVVYQDPQKIQVTKDNADLFIDAVLKLQDEQIKENQRLQGIYDILETIVE